jgi:hypothetical protein
LTEKPKKPRQNNEAAERKCLKPIFLLRRITGLREKSRVSATPDYSVSLCRRGATNSWRRKEISAGIRRWRNPVPLTPVSYRSWAQGSLAQAGPLLYLARGLNVVAANPSPNSEAKVRQYVDAVWHEFTVLGLSPSASRDHLEFTRDMSQALSDGDFVQENAPERQDSRSSCSRILTPLLPPTRILRRVHSA